MKTKKSLICFFFLIFFHFVHAQKDSVSTNSKVKVIVNVNVLKLVKGELRLTFEKPIKHNISLEYGGGVFYSLTYSELAGYPTWNDWFMTLGYEGYIFPYIFSVGPDLRGGIKIFFMKKFDHEGFYINPLGYAEYFVLPGESNLSGMGLQLSIGYKMPTKKKWQLDFYGGIGEKFMYQRDGFYGYSDNGRVTFRNPVVGVNIGYKIMRK